MTGSQGVRVTFHPWDVRPDRDEWIVVRQGGDQVIALPHIGMAAVRLMARGSTIEETRGSLRVTNGCDIDVANLVEQLATAGLVASIGERRFPAAPVAVSFPRLRSRHVRWSLSPVLHVFVLSVPAAALTVAAVRPGVLPTWDSLLWTEYGTFTLLVQCAVAWCLIALHEAAHLVTARAAGVPGRIRLGTRLQFLVAQTAVSGIWLKGRRERLTVYLSGLALDGVIWGACLLARALGADWVLLPVIVATLFLALANQCLVFMRTDLYFVVQDLTGCRNLFGDTARHLRHVAARSCGRRVPHPLRSLSAAERRSVRIYAVAMVAGSVVCVAVGLLVLTEFTWPLVRRSVTHVVSGADWWIRFDALATVLILVGLQGLWARLWWRRHGEKVRGIGGLIRTFRSGC